MGKRPEAGSTSPGAPSALSSRVPKQPSSFGLAGFASWFYFIMFFFLVKGLWGLYLSGPIRNWKPDGPAGKENEERFQLVVLGVWLDFRAAREGSTVSDMPPVQG